MSTDRAEPRAEGRPRILFVGREDDWQEWRGPLSEALAEAGIAVDLGRDHAAADVDWIVYSPGGPAVDFTPFTHARAVLGLWAGVEGIVGNATLTMPLARMVDDGLRQGMVEWVVAHVLRLHLGIDAHLRGQDGIWRHDDGWDTARLAQDRPVTVLGLGELGLSVANALAGLGFPVTGWSRSPKAAPNLARCLSGPEGIDAALTGAGIVVLLTPLTPETENLMSAARLALPERGFFLINPGRGALIDDDALIAALDAGQVGHATLDVFREEPLPPAHPYWAHPGVTVTPHVAAATRPASAARVIAENVRRGEAGEPLLHLVDRRRGY